MEDNGEALCDICCETYNKLARKKIACHSCHFHACKSCWEKTFFSSINEPSCMNRDCKIFFSAVFLIQEFTKSFYLNKLKPVIGDFLLEKEKALLPQTQHIVEDKIRLEQLVKEITTITHELEQINMIRKKIREEYHATPLSTEPERKKALLSEYRNYNEYYNGMYVRREQLKIEAQIKNDNPTVNKKQFVLPCGYGECKGFLSNEIVDHNYFCKLCETYTCKKCHKNIGKTKVEKKEHTCDPNDIESVKEIHSQSKPCPNCGKPIIKHSGCNQMFCTACNTPFNWKTLEIYRNGQFHNPHYLEWRNRGGTNMREPNDMICGGVPTLLVKFTRFKISEYFQQKVAHVRGDLMEAINTEMNRENVALEKLRVEYLLQKINEKEWRNKLFALNKKKLFNREKYLLFDMFSNSGIYILNNMNTDTAEKFIHLVGNSGKGRVIDTYPDIKSYFTEIINLCDYCTIQLEKLCDTFGYKFNENNNDMNLRITERVYKETNNAFKSMFGVQL